MASIPDICADRDERSRLGDLPEAVRPDRDGERVTDSFRRWVNRRWPSRDKQGNDPC